MQRCLIVVDYQKDFISGSQATPFERIEFVGLVSNICIISNAILAKTAQPETPVVVHADCTASHDAKLHQAAPDVMIGLHIRVARRIEDKGPFYHGTKADWAVDDMLTSRGATHS